MMLRAASWRDYFLSVSLPRRKRASMHEIVAVIINETKERKAMNRFQLEEITVD